MLEALMPLAIKISTQFLVAFIYILVLFTETFSEQKYLFFSMWPSTGFLTVFMSF